MVVAGLLASRLPSRAANSPAGRPVSFNRDVRPILAENCFTCHGQDAKARKAGLRLDVREEALRGGKSKKPAVVPGDPNASALVARLVTQDPEDVMPPKDSGKVVSPAQREMLRRWIAEGARYEGHWAFQPPARPEASPGLVRRSPGPGNTLDELAAARLSREGLQTSRPAPPEALLRRVSLDLVGLPPTLRELDDFQAAWRKDPEAAYGAAVDRLLASPHFGEKWARHWLDAARYADSDGYEKDLPRDQSPWRDWVIRALNADMPYDQFIVEQIAGDLLPNATQDQRIATGFLRNSMVNEEGAILAEQFRMDAMFDRMDCIGKSILGMSLQCGQCHSHKYDPLTQEEYYRMFAFLNDTYESTSWAYTSEQRAAIDRIHRETARLEAELKSRAADWASREREWEGRVRQAAIRWRPLEPVTLEWVGGLSHPEAMKDQSVITLGFRPTVGELWMVATNLGADRPTGLRLEALTHGDLPFGGPGRGAKGNFAISELEVEVRPLGKADAPWSRVTLQDATADFAEPEHRLEAPYRTGADDKRMVGPASFLIDGKEETAWGADRGPGRRHEDIQWVARFSPTNRWPEGPAEVKVQLKYRHGGTDAHGRHNQFLGRFRVSVTTDPNPAADGLTTEARLALAVPADGRSEAQRAALFTAWRQAAAAGEAGPARETTAAIDALWHDHPEGIPVLTLSARSPEQGRVTHILERGAWDKPRQPVEPGVPAFLPPLPALGARDRLAFGRWLVDPRSPTTARVFVNRVWQALFGLGLVETPEDFGVRAALPTQPDLLDWLAVEFMQPSTPGARPWGMKHLVRTIVLSRTYRQDSRISPTLQARDPQNRLLARGPRFRAESEVVRDIALSASGLLTDRVGGPSFYPPVPESMFALNFVKLDWNPAPAPERYRRSLYMFRRRSMPDPVMASLDAPNGDLACVRRVRSNTPLAALTQLNEPVFVEAAQALAQRILRDGGATETSRIVHGFRLCTGRSPTTAELRELRGLLGSRRQHIAEGWQGAGEVAFGGTPQPSKLPPGTTPTEAAAWTVVSRVLLNLDETITKQ
jgi:hypothetical protein